jgi:hypothetical protein
MSGRTRGVIVGVAVLAVVVLWFGWWSDEWRPRRGGGAPAERRLLSRDDGAPADLDDRIARWRDRDLPARRDDQPAAPLELDEQAFMPSWEAVDMEAVRRAMPDNVYWEMSAPTDDPEVLERRRAERERWNVEYGKVLSGTGTEEDVRDYYDQRARLFGDYVEFTTYLIEHYEEVLPERDLGMLMLARRLNQARLEEVPRQVEEALARTRAQIAAREAWQADRELFEAQQALDAGSDGAE